MKPRVSKVANRKGYRFDCAAAKDVINFFEKFLRHSKGKWAGRRFELLPFQKKILRQIFGWKRADGTRRYRTVYIEIPRKSGKMLSLDTVLPTPDGWTTIGEIRVGDYVFASDGIPCRVTAISDIDPAPVSYRLTFSNGEVIMACADHQWLTTARVDTVGAYATKTRRKIRRWKAPSRLVYGKYVRVQTYGKQKYVGTVNDPDIDAKVKRAISEDLALHPVGIDTMARVRTTQELYKTQYYGKRNNTNHSIQMPMPLQLPATNLPISPYVLGIWLGDGTTVSANLTVGAQDIDFFDGQVCADGISFRKKQYQCRSSYTVRLGGRRGRPNETCQRGHPTSEFSKGKCPACERMTDYARRHDLPLPARTCVTMQEELRALDVLGNKHIPLQYLRASYSQRLALLQGLMDTDGCVGKKGNHFEYVTIIERLALDMAELLATFGIKAKIAGSPSKLYGRIVGYKWRITYNAFRDIVPVFRMPRKLERMCLSSQTKYNPRSSTVQIILVEPCEPVPMRCIQVDHPAHEYLVGRTMIPTHNSTLSSGIALYLLFADREAGAEIFSAAADRDQAAIVFDLAKTMVEMSPELRSRSQIFRRSIVVPKLKASYRVLSADVGTKHGLNAHGVIFDELHVQPNRDLFDVLTTSTGARTQPLFVSITTAGYDRESICWEQHDYALKTLDGVIEDPTFFAYIAAAGDDEDWTDPKVWKEANPGYGITIQEDYLRTEAERAKNVPAYQNTFRRLHLDTWTQQNERWLDLSAWDDCADAVDVKKLAGHGCYAGLDLASSTDIAALVLVFPNDDGSYDVLPFFWVPAENMRERGLKDRAPYETWARQGYIIPTPGNVIDFKAIEGKIKELEKQYFLHEVAFDRWGAIQITQNLEAEGIKVVPEGQGFATMSGPTKDLLTLVLSKKIRHGGNPVLRFMADSMVVRQDPAGNIKPDKAKSSARIDGMVALIMGLHRTMLDRSTGSIFDDPDTAFV